jgi:hypothetical protein
MRARDGSPKVTTHISSLHPSLKPPVRHPAGDALPNSVNGIIASIRKYVAVFDLDFRIQQSAGVKCPLIDIATTISGVVRSFSNAGDTT